jgi:hypothetical protein
MSEKTEQPPEPIVLSVAVIEGGKNYPAGSETPFTEETLPEHLRPHLVTGDEPPPFRSSARNIYTHMRPPGEPAAEPEVIYHFASDGIVGRSMLRQASQIGSMLQEQAYAEQQAEAAGRLSPELEDALRAKLELYIGKVLAQAQYNQDAIDTLHESLAAASELQKLFVKRGAVYTETGKVKLRPGEKCFVRIDNEWSFVDIVNSDGEVPEPPLIP